MKIVIGSRGSQLAMWQTHHIKSLLEQAHPGLEIEIRKITTRGDAIQDIPLPKIGDKGLFTAEIEAELLADNIQLAVHSLKDLPTTLPDGLVYGGSPPRADARDALISLKWRSIEDIPDNGTIATGSLRRKAAILNLKPGMQFTDLRGNIDTRLRKLAENGWDGIIMAAAALERLEMVSEIAAYLDPEFFVPSVSQGAIGLEVNTNRTDVLELLTAIVDRETVQSCLAERAFGRTLEGGCSVPLGAWARREGEALKLTGFVSNYAGTHQIRESLIGSPEEAETLGEKLAERFISLGAKELLGS